MTAVSTALRKRWRTAFIRYSNAVYEKTLTDNLDVDDSPVPMYVRIVPGDRIESVADSQSLDYIQGPSAVDTLSVSDSILVTKSKSPILFDTVDVDELIAIQRLRDRETNDSISIRDFYEKNITRVTFTIISKVLNNKVTLSDGLSADKSGIKLRSLSDNITVVDYPHRKPIRDITRFASAELIDNFNVVITRYVAPPTIIINGRVLSDDIELTDSEIATFTGIVQKIVSEAIAVNDFDKVINYSVNLDSLDTAEASVILRLVNRVPSEYAQVTDDMIVTRNALARERTLTDSITVFDQALETYTEFVQVSADIIVDIEVP